MSLKVFGVKIKVTFVFFAIICLMLFIDRSGLALPTIFAASMHEAAHLLAMKKLGCAPNEIELIPGSIKIINPKRYNRKKENIILISGPLCNMLLFLIFYLFYMQSKNIVLAKWAVVELIVGFFNLLPAKGLDGGALLLNLLISIISAVKANFIYICISVFTGTFFIIFGAMGALSGFINPSITLIGVYILILSFSK